MFKDLQAVKPFTGDVMIRSSYPCIDTFNQLRGFIPDKERCIERASSLSIEGPYRQSREVIGCSICLDQHLPRIVWGESIRQDQDG